jgi:hypothetical protein
MAGKRALPGCTDIVVLISERSARSVAVRQVGRQPRSIMLTPQELFGLGLCRHTKNGKKGLI